MCVVYFFIMIIICYKEKIQLKVCVLAESTSQNTTLYESVSHQWLHSCVRVMYEYLAGCPSSESYTALK